MYKDQANYFLNCVVNKKKADVDILKKIAQQLEKAGH